MPSQFAGLGGPPTKWSFSSGVTTNSVLSLVMPSLARRAKNLPKRGVIFLQLGDIAGFAGTEGPRTKAVVMRIGDIEVDHLHTGLQHHHSVAERLRRQRAESIRKARAAERVSDHVAVEVLHRAALRDHRLY